MALFIPEIVLCCTITLLLVFSLAKNQLQAATLRNFMLLAGALLMGACLYTGGMSGDLFSGTYRVDLLSQAFKMLIAGGFFVTLLLSAPPMAIPANKTLEYYFFLSTSALGMMMLASSSNLLVLYVSMELSSYSLYILTALKRDRKNAEAGVKYLILGAVASGFFLWGASFVLGMAQTASLPLIAQNLTTLSAQPVFLLGLVFMSFAFLFKLSAFPLHFWAPDVYESAAMPVTTFVATASKAAAVAVLVRFFLWTSISAPIVTWLGLLAFLSMTLGNTVALVQKDIKRLLAYSSVAQAGYILVGLLSGTDQGYSATFFYAMAYLLMNAAVFVVATLVAQSARQDNPLLWHFDGLAERSPFLALLLLLGLLSLAGIPPLVGFTGKWILFAAAMNQGHWFLVLWAVLNSVVSLFYYLTVVKHAYLEKPQNNSPIVITLPVKCLCFFLFAALVLLGVFPAPIIEFSQQAISLAG